MRLPQPTEAFTNPVKYWNEVMALQMEMAAQSWRVACAINPFLPEGIFAGTASVARGGK